MALVIANIGGNIGDVKRNIDRAILAIGQEFGQYEISEMVESDPWGFESTNSFFNIGIKFSSDLDPHQILMKLLAIEREISSVSHRNADGSYADREIDIDLIAVGNHVIDDEELTLPHPRLSQRNFFLLPLKELAPDWRHPVTGLTAEQMLKPTYIIATGNGKILVSKKKSDKESDSRPELPKQEDIAIYPSAEPIKFSNYIGLSLEEIDNESTECVKSTNSTEAFESGKFELIPLREFLQKRIDLYGQVSRAASWVAWSSKEKLCSFDGACLINLNGYGKKCPVCNREVFPRMDPAIVVLVKNGDKALLVHSRTMKNDVMALVAGFVEYGETLEECVAREVMEETGLEIENIRYLGSQSWPFPNQLIIGFVAELKKGEIEMLDGELTKADFFDREALPLLPSLPSLSRKIIDKWVNGEI